jgi:hypothetical protein
MTPSYSLPSMAREMWLEFKHEVSDKVTHVIGHQQQLKDFHFWNHEDDDVPANDTQSDEQPERQEVVIEDDPTPV